MTNKKGKRDNKEESKSIKGVVFVASFLKHLTKVKSMVVFYIQTGLGWRCHSSTKLTNKQSNENQWRQNFITRMSTGIDEKAMSHENYEDNAK